MNFPTQFCLGSLFEKLLLYVKLEEASYKGNVFDFSVDCDAIDKSSCWNVGEINSKTFKNY